MEIRNLGQSGLRVSTIGLGCNNFGGRIDLEATRAVVVEEQRSRRVVEPHDAEKEPEIADAGTPVVEAPRKPMLPVTRTEVKSSHFLLNEYWHL